jgi:formylglycine-generating enzyme required for sulfatase activity
MSAAHPDTLTLDLPGGVPLEFRRISAGAFRMGQRGGGPDEEPIHWVVIAEDFYLGVFPVTQAQYRAMATHCLGDLGSIEGNLGADPSHFKGDNRPVEQVSWGDARCVCQWLSGSGLLPAGWIADLPSEAQWEYACRAGTETKYWSGDREEGLARVGWYGGNADGETHPVGAKGEAGLNDWGLSDLHGNVWEWCLDYYDLRRYRKVLDADGADASLDPTRIEFAGADPAVVAIAEMLGRFGAGEFVLREGDRETLLAYQGIAESAVENGNDQWTDDIKAAGAARKQNLWPAAAQALARGSQVPFQNALDAASDEESPARVLRGGAWINAAAFCRSAYRIWFAPGSRDWYFGFRLAVVPGSGGTQSGRTEAERRDGGGARRDAAAEPQSGRGAAGNPPRSGGDLDFD